MSPWGLGGNHLGIGWQREGLRRGRSTRLSMRRRGCHLMVLNGRGVGADHVVHFVLARGRCLGLLVVGGQEVELRSSSRHKLLWLLVMRGWLLLLLLHLLLSRDRGGG